MMSWDRLLSSQRLGRSPSRARQSQDRTGRSEFLSDVDRITFAASFRRLGGKTQVFPLATNDHVHNRLTHSLEVSRVGRTLGFAVGHELFKRSNLKGHRPSSRSADDFGAIVEAACLSHDIGHPPFGHAGDRAIRYWFDHSAEAKRLSQLVSDAEFSDLRNFDGNAQGFRRIAQLDKNVFAGGLNLTLSTLAAYIKYPHLSAGTSSKTGFFLTEQKIVENLAENLGLIKLRDGFARHPLSLLVEAADDACYGFLDLEDAVEVGVLSLPDVATILLRALPVNERRQYRPRAGEKSHRIVFAKMRGKIFREAIKSAVRTFFLSYESILKGSFQSGLLEEAASSGEGPAKVLLDAKQLVRDKVFPFDSKVNVELGGYAVLGYLLEEFVRAALVFAEAYKCAPRRPDIDSKSEILLNMLGDHRPRNGNAPPGADWTAYQCVRRIMDFITGMTDDFAIRISRQLSGQIALRT